MKNLPEPQILAHQRGNGGAAHGLFAALDIPAHQHRRLIDTGTPRGSERIKIGESQSHLLCARQRRLQRISAALDAAIHYHVDPIAYVIRVLCKLLEGNA